MKNFFQLIAFLLLGLFYGQNPKPIANRVLDLQKQGNAFVKISPFKKDNNADKLTAYRQVAKDAEVLRLNLQAINKLQNLKPKGVDFHIPFKGDSIEVLLVKTPVLANNFKVRTNKRDHVDYTPGTHYQGIVKNDPKSVVSISVFGNGKIMGVIYTSNDGNIVIGEAKNKKDIIIYNDKTLKDKNPFFCESDKLKPQRNPKPNFKKKKVSSPQSLTENCVRVYYEVGHSLFKDNDSLVGNTVDWLIGLHGVVQTLYANDSVNIRISEIFVWENPDPYTQEDEDGPISLELFQHNRPDFNGDVAHLLYSPPAGGVAYLSSLCTDYPHAFSSLSTSYRELPNYSWGVNVITHEMGHSLGSPHTHACAWNGNNTAIDGCGPAVGSDEGCNAPLPPLGEGTIMSYCHLLRNVGVNFTMGFGPQPAQLIRETVEASGCLGTDCVTSCPMNVSNLKTENITRTSVVVSFEDTGGTEWKYRLSDNSGRDIERGTTTNRSLTFTDLNPGTYYTVSVGDTCSGANAFQTSILFLTDADWCDSSILFTDTGGVDANYSDMESFEKTFYPTQPDKKLKLTFTDFDLEEDYDKMTVYDGTNTTSPVFPGGEDISGNLVPGPFTATNPEGAITLVFNSDQSFNQGGWVAYFECVEDLSTQENSSPQNPISVYPNPTKREVFLETNEGVLAYQLLDTTAKLVIREELKLSRKSVKIDLSGLPKGVYILSVKTNSGTFQKKIIKE